MAVVECNELQSLAGLESLEHFSPFFAMATGNDDGSGQLKRIRRHGRTSSAMTGSGSSRGDTVRTSSATINAQIVRIQRYATTRMPSEKERLGRSPTVDQGDTVGEV